jgi:hypothetical protein
MFVKTFTVMTNLVAKPCALDALPFCLFVESIPMTSQPMMKSSAESSAKAQPQEEVGPTPEYEKKQ